jgi:hypothetical protein
MENNKLIAEALLEIAQRSETTFLAVGKEDKEIIDAAKKIGIELPSPDLMVMKTVYAEINKVNLNGVILPNKAVKEGLNTLIGKQCNWEHNGSGFVCGYTISAKINDDKIETINVIFKSLFPEQAEELKEKVKSGEAAVSFEIWNINPENKKSVVKELDNGFKEISPIIFHGTGVLLAHKPACPKAKIFKLVANKEINEAEKIIDKVFSEDLIFAQMAVEEPKCKNCKTCDCGKDKEEIIMIKCEKCGKEFEPSTDEKICVECASLLKEEIQAQVPEELKTEVKAEETKPVDAGVETKPEESKVEVTSEVKVEEKAQEVETIVPKIVVKVTSIYSEIRIDTFVDGSPSGTQEVRGYNKKITEYQDGTKDEVEEEVEIKKKFDFAEVEEKVNTAKAEKDVEIATLKTEHEKVMAEKDKEITNLKTELGTKDQEIADLKNPKVEEPKEKKLEVGNVETEKISETKKQAQKINEIIASKHQR